MHTIGSLPLLAISLILIAHTVALPNPSPNKPPVATPPPSLPPHLVSRDALLRPAGSGDLNPSPEMMPLSGPLLPVHTISQVHVTHITSLPLERLSIGGDLPPRPTAIPTWVPITLTDEPPWPLSTAANTAAANTGVAQNDPPIEDDPIDDPSEGPGDDQEPSEGDCVNTRDEKANPGCPES